VLLKKGQRIKKRQRIEPRQIGLQWSRNAAAAMPNVAQEASDVFPVSGRFCEGARQQAVNRRNL